MTRTLLPALVLLTPLCPAQEPHQLSIDKLLDFERVSNPRVSPDGKVVVYTRSWVDKLNDRRRSSLWIMDRDGQNKRFLCKGSSPVWAPDGSRIAFIAEGEPKGSQVQCLYLEDRSITQLTHLDQAPSGLRWAPDGRSLAFSMQVPKAHDFKISLPKRPKGAKWAPEPRIITRLDYRRDRRGYSPSGYRHIFVLDANGGTPRQVSSGDYQHGSPVWHPDGRALYFSARRMPDAAWQIRDSAIYKVDIADGKVVEVTSRPGSESSLAISPDGRFLAYQIRPKNEDTYNISDVRIARLQDQPGAAQIEVVRTLRLDRQPSGLVWAKDNSAVYTTYRDRGEAHLWRLPTDPALRAEKLSSGRLQFSLSEVLADGTAIGTRRAPHEPGDIWTLDGGSWQRLTQVNADVMHGIRLGQVEEVLCKSHGGLEIQGWLIKPPDFDAQKQYPLVLQIHGGPHGMYGIDFSFERQFFAASGYLVLYTNPRGSLGYGKAFGNAINNAYPGHDYDDLMNQVDTVIARGNVDTDNMFVYGGSGGGVLTAWIVGHTDRFSAAVSMFPVTNWISFVGTTDGPYWYSNFKQLPWEGIEEHWNRSPLKHVGKVKTPTMLLTGELDLRTPMSQSEEFYQALKLRKVDTMLIRVADEYHGAAGRFVSNQLRRILYVKKWFEKYRSKPATADASGKR